MKRLLRVQNRLGRIRELKEILENIVSMIDKELVLTES
jgi:hypothetical protein